MVSPPAVAAQEEHRHLGPPAQELGKVHFPVSCSPAAQTQFDLAVAMLHSFWYEEALKEFTAVTETDPACTMGYWGIAMSLWRALWNPPDAASLREGQAAVEKANSVGIKTDRERAYVNAIGAFYRDFSNLDYRTRELAYEKAMEQVHRQYPEDREAAIFYALALIVTALPTDKTYANQRKAGEILEPLLAEQPDHPGVAHYIIHAYDYPPLAPRALDAARRYSKIAPAVPHALHMPSHIFTRLGLWDESIASNLASESAARDFEVRTHMSATWDEHLHAMDYLMYAYLQTGQLGKSRHVLDELSSIRKVEPMALKVAYAFAAIPARYAVERGWWQQAASLTVRPDSVPWEHFPQMEALTHFARALGAARTGNIQQASQEVQTLGALHAKTVAGNDAYWGAQVEIQRRAASAWLAHAQGRNKEALETLRAAADLEDSSEKEPVTPGPILPARELLGDLLLELHQPAQALAEFEASLKTSPNRFNALYGAARAARLSGDTSKAQAYYRNLLAACGKADGQLPELDEARKFVIKSDR